MPHTDESPWRNLPIPEKVKAAETRDEFRGQYEDKRPVRGQPARTTGASSWLGRLGSTMG
jgi:hypothetical protein